MFNRKTVDTVLTQFHKAISDLQLVAVEHTDHATSLTTSIDRLTAERTAAVTEASRADALVKKLNSLIA